MDDEKPKVGYKRCEWCYNWKDPKDLKLVPVVTMAMTTTDPIEMELVCKPCLESFEHDFGSGGYTTEGE